MRRQAQGAAVRQNDGLLGTGVAGGGLSDQGRPVIVLQHLGKELRFTEAAPVDEDHHRKLEAHAVRLGDAFRPVLADVREQAARRQQIVQEDRRLGGQSACVFTHVDDQCRCALRQQVFHRVHRGLAAAGLKVVDLHIARARLLQTEGDRLGVGRRTVDLQWFRHARDGEGKLAAQLRADQRSHLVRAHAGHILAVHGHDDHADHHARFGRRGIRHDRDDLKASAGILHEAHADVGILVGRGQLIGAVLIVGEKAAPGIPQARDHGRCRGVAHALAVDLIDVLFVYDVLDFDIALRFLIVFLAADSPDDPVCCDDAGSDKCADKKKQDKPQRDPQPEQTGKEPADVAQQPLQESWHGSYTSWQR